MPKNENFGITLDVTQDDLKTFDKEIERGRKKLENARKKQTNKISSEQKKNQKIRDKDREKGSLPYLPGGGQTQSKITDKTSAGPLAGFGKKQSRTFDDAVEQSLDKMLGNKLKKQFEDGGVSLLGQASGLLGRGGSNAIAGFAQKIAPVAIALTVAESTKQIIQVMQQKGGWLDRFVKDSVNTLYSKLRDKQLTYSIKMGFARIILVSDSTANPQVVYDSYKQYNENRDRLEDDWKVRETSIF